MAQLYTLAEVKLHDGKNGNRTWVVISDIVYDVTDYIGDVSESEAENLAGLCVYRFPTIIWACFYAPNSILAVRN